MIYLIWSYKRDAWWREGGHGYTRDVIHAGQYTEKEAHDITDRYEFDDQDRSVMLEAGLVYTIVTVDAERRKEEEMERRNAIQVRAREA